MEGYVEYYCTRTQRDISVVTDGEYRDCSSKEIIRIYGHPKVH
jgi:hypothetical protein